MIMKKMEYPKSKGVPHIKQLYLDICLVKISQNKIFMRLCYNKS